MGEYEAWTGKSGYQYQFKMYSFGDVLPHYGGVYIVARPTQNLLASLGRAAEALYVGKAQSFYDRVFTGLESHHKWPEFRACGAQFIGVHIASTEAERARIELDLIQGLRPQLNEVGIGSYLNPLAGL